MLERRAPCASCQVTGGSVPGCSPSGHRDLQSPNIPFSYSLLSVLAQCFCSFPFEFPAPISLWRRRWISQASDSIRSSQRLSSGGVIMHFTKQTSPLAGGPFGCHDDADRLCLGVCCALILAAQGPMPQLSLPNPFNRLSASWRHLTLTVLRFGVALPWSAKNCLA